MKNDRKDDYVNVDCIPVDKDETLKNNPPKDHKDISQGGSYKAYKDPKLEDTATDIYYKTQCKLPNSKVAIPTYDSVVEAKEWVDDENKM